MTLIDERGKGGGKVRLLLHAQKKRPRPKDNSMLTSIRLLVRSEGVRPLLRAAASFWASPAGAVLPSERGAKRFPASSEGQLTDRKAVSSVRGIMADA